MRKRTRDVAQIKGDSDQLDPTELSLAADGSSVDLDTSDEDNLTESDDTSELYLPNRGKLKVKKNASAYVKRVPRQRREKSKLDPTALIEGLTGDTFAFGEIKSELDSSDTSVEYVPVRKKAPGRRNEKRNSEPKLRKIKHIIDRESMHTTSSDENLPAEVESSGRTLVPDLSHNESRSRRDGRRSKKYEIVALESLEDSSFENVGVKSHESGGKRSTKRNKRADIDAEHEKYGEERDSFVNRKGREVAESMVRDLSGTVSVRKSSQLRRKVISDDDMDGDLSPIDANNVEKRNLSVNQRGKTRETDDSKQRETSMRMSARKGSQLRRKVISDNDVDGDLSPIESRHDGKGNLSIDQRRKARETNDSKQRETSMRMSVIKSSHLLKKRISDDDMDGDLSPIEVRHKEKRDLSVNQKGKAPDADDYKNMETSKIMSVRKSNHLLKKIISDNDMDGNLSPIDANHVEKRNLSVNQRGKARETDDSKQRETSMRMSARKGSQLRRKVISDDDMDGDLSPIEVRHKVKRDLSVNNSKKARETNDYVPKETSGRTSVRKSSQLQRKIISDDDIDGDLNSIGAKHVEKRDLSVNQSEKATETDGYTPKETPRRISVRRSSQLQRKVISDDDMDGDLNLIEVRHAGKGDLSVNNSKKARETNDFLPKETSRRISVRKSSQLLKKRISDDDIDGDLNPMDANHVEKRDLTVNQSAKAIVTANSMTRKMPVRKDIQFVKNVISDDDMDSDYNPSGANRGKIRYSSVNRRGKARKTVDSMPRKIPRTMSVRRGSQVQKKISSDDDMDSDNNPNGVKLKRILSVNRSGKAGKIPDSIAKDTPRTMSVRKGRQVQKRISSDDDMDSDNNPSGVKNRVKRISSVNRSGKAGKFNDSNAKDTSRTKSVRKGSQVQKRISTENEVGMNAREIMAEEKNTSMQNQKSNGDDLRGFESIFQRINSPARRKSQINSETFVPERKNLRVGQKKENIYSFLHDKRWNRVDSKDFDDEDGADHRIGKAKKPNSDSDKILQSTLINSSSETVNIGKYFDGVSPIRPKQFHDENRNQSAEGNLREDLGSSSVAEKELTDYGFVSIILKNRIILHELNPGGIVNFTNNPSMRRSIYIADAAAALRAWEGSSEQAGQCVLVKDIINVEKGPLFFIKNESDGVARVNPDSPGCTGSREPFAQLQQTCGGYA